LQHILRVLERHDGNRERAAAALCISRRTLYRRLKELRTATRGFAPPGPAVLAV
jgi:transcriptional regulator with PAS, ATPase and Fis domain